MFAHRGNAAAARRHRQRWMNRGSSAPRPGAAGHPLRASENSHNRPVADISPGRSKDSPSVETLAARAALRKLGGCCPTSSRPCQWKNSAAWRLIPGAINARRQTWALSDRAWKDEEAQRMSSEAAGDVGAFARPASSKAKCPTIIEGLLLAGADRPGRMVGSPLLQAGGRSCACNDCLRTTLSSRSAPSGRPPQSSPSLVRELLEKKVARTL